MNVINGGRPRRQPARRPGVHARPGRAAARSPRRCGRGPRSSTRSSGSCGSRSTRPASATRAASRPTCPAPRRRSTCWSAPSRRPATGPGEDVWLALDVAATELWRDGRYHAPGEGATWATDELIALLRAARRPVPPGLDRGRPPRGRLGRLGRADRAPRRPAPARRRRPVRDEPGAARRGHPARRRQRDPGQGEPDRHADRDARGRRAGEVGGLRRRRLPPLGGDRGHLHRRPRRRPSTPARSRPGSLSRSDRVAKYNQLLRIEEWLGDAARWPGPAVLRRGAPDERRATLTRPEPGGSWSGRSSSSRWPRSSATTGCSTSGGCGRRSTRLVREVQDARGRERAPVAARSPSCRTTRPSSSASPARSSGWSGPASACCASRAAPAASRPRRSVVPPRSPYRGAAAPRTLMRWTGFSRTRAGCSCSPCCSTCRAAWKLAIDWAGMLTTVRFVRAGLRARAASCPTEETLEREPAPPCSCTSSPPTRSRGSRRRCAGSSASAIPHERARYVVVTKAAEDAAPHPAMPESTGALVPAVPRRTCRPTTPSGSPTSSCPGPGARPSSSTGRSGPRRSAQVLEDDAADPAPGVRRRLRRRLGSRPRHAPLDRRRGARRARRRSPTRA